MFVFTDDLLSVNSTEHFSRLTINEVKATDAGKYEIRVKNSIGQTSAMSTLNVGGKVTQCLKLEMSR